MKKLKQGQTLHIVSLDFSQSSRRPKPRMVTLFMYSQKEPLPPQHCSIEKMPVSKMNDIIEFHNYGFRTRSRRKAVTRLKQLEREHAQKE